MRIEVHRGHKTVHALLTGVGQMTIGGAYMRGIQNNGYRNKAEQLKQTDSKTVFNWFISQVKICLQWYGINIQQNFVYLFIYFAIYLAILTHYYTNILE